MANVAIKGHPTRGREVIEILEMFGGKSNGNMNGYNDDLYYYIAKYGLIYGSGIEYEELACNYSLFTLEEFEKKFPYKVGDKVSILAGTNYVFTIKSMTWDTDQVIYKIKSIDGIEYDEHDWLADELIYYTEHKEETMEESDEKAVKHVYDTEVISFDIAQRDKYELDLQGKFEVVLREGKYYVERIKPQYPKTYKECCEALMGKTDFQDFELMLTKLSTNINEENSISPEPPYINLINNFYKLLICRAAYWKIAGKEMGLEKPWEPDWIDSNFKYCLKKMGYNIAKLNEMVISCILAFPTAEMRDAFSENFKELIEQCKELL